MNRTLDSASPTALSAIPGAIRAAARIAVAAACLAAPIQAFTPSKSGVGPNVITLPSGAGTIQGLGETFQPDLNTGTPRYEVPLVVPAGPNGLSPSVELEFNGGFGNGPMGVGWRLTVPFVQRKTVAGIPRYVDGPNGIDDDGDGIVDDPDELDEFINQAGKTLIPNAEGHYLQDQEEEFIRYRRVGDHWEGRRPDGTLLEFGLTAQSRQFDADTGRVFAWMLERETDTHGNTILYNYESFTGRGNRNRIYLSSILYGPGPPQDGPVPWENFHIVRFAYEPRPDWFENCAAGFVVRTGMRLTNIIVATQGPERDGHRAGDVNEDGVTDYLVREYAIAYEAHSFWSLPTRITLIGADGESSLPPLTFEWDVYEIADELSADGAIIDSINTPLYLMDRPEVDLVDMNSDGLPDILKTEPLGGLHTVYLNRGETVDESDRRVMDWSPGQPVGGDERVWAVNLAGGAEALFADMDADSLADLVYKAGNDVFYFPNAPEGDVPKWGERVHMSLGAGAQAPVFPFETPGTVSADIDNDARRDIIQSVSVQNVAHLRIWRNLDGVRYSEPVTVPQPVPHLLSNEHVSLEEWNADDVPDLIRITPTALEIAAGLGHGRFAAVERVVFPDTVLTQSQMSGVELVDVDNNGLPDVVIARASPGELWYWLNKGAYELEHRRVITNMPIVISDSPNIQWTDINGSGTNDLLYIDPGAPSRLRAVDVGELLLSTFYLLAIDNGLGRRISIEYDSQYPFQFADRDAGKPWADPIPMPIFPVVKVITEDTLGNTYETEYAYHDGFFTRREAVIIGFSEVEEIERGDDTAPTLVTRSFFDVGREHFARRGRLLRRVLEDDTGAPFVDERTDWDLRVLHAGADGREATFMAPVFQSRDVLERGHGGPKRLESEFEYDGYGNLVEQRLYGVVENGDRNAFNDEQITTLQYAVNLERWIVRKPAREEVRDGAGNLVSRTETFYDDDSFSGMNFGEIAVGNATLVRKWTHPSNDLDFVQERVHYDAFGNAVALLDPLARAPAGVIDDEAGHYRTIDYDEAFRTFPVAETVHVGAGREDLVMQALYDEGFGVVIASTDFNGHVTRYRYDSFGRLTASIRPEDDPDFPTAEYAYAMAVPVGDGGLVNYVETRLLDAFDTEKGGNRLDRYFISRQYVDGLGRPLMTRTEAEPDPDTGAVRVVVSGAGMFNQRRTRSIELNPFFTLVEGDTLDALLAYEDITAPEWAGRFHVDGEDLDLGLDDAPAVSTDYDATLRAVRVTQPDGAFQITQYAPLQVIMFDENDTDDSSPFAGTPTVRSQDGRGRLVRVDEHVRLEDDGAPAELLQTWTTRYEYRADDALTAILDSQGNEKRMEYDGLRRMTFMDDPDRGAVNLYYDAASNVVETVDAKNQRILYTYDGANRLVTEDYLDESESFSFGFAFDPARPVSPENRPDAAYFYDDPAGPLDLGDGRVETAANLRGRLAFVLDLAGETHVSYDSRGRKTWAAKRVPDGLTGALVSYTTEMTYDPQDRVVEVRYPDGDRVQYEYNERGLLARIVGGATANRGMSPFLVSDTVYAPSGQRLRYVYGNGVESDYDFDTRGRLRALTAARLDTPDAPLLAYEYEYDAVSNIVAIHDLRPESVRGAGDPLRNTQRFAYDDLYRLIYAQYSFHTPGQNFRDDGDIVYRYDRIGNMIAMTSPIVHDVRGRSVTNIGVMDYGGALGSRDRIGRAPNDPPGPHALTRADDGVSPPRSFTYDANGNMTAIDNLAATWDYKDRLVAVEDETTLAHYVYDYTDQRVIKRMWRRGPDGRFPDKPDSETLYLGKHFEVRPNGQPVKFVFNGDDRIAMVAGSLDPAAPRIQRLFFAEGWNLISLAVDAPDAVRQIQAAAGAVVEAMYRVEGGDYVMTGPEDPLAAGTVLWVRAAAPATASIVGAYTDPGPQSLPIEDGYIAFATLDPVNVKTALPAAVERTWAYDGPDQRWRAKFAGNLDFLSDLPDFIHPGQPVFVDVEGPATAALPAPARRIRYYFPDHLGSANVVADASGEIVEETVYYPFGEPRRQFRAEGVFPPNPYLFGQKERDEESNLHYFESRYLVASLGRFNRVDPVAEDVPAEALADPQLLHPYAFARNNPIAFTDPDGKFITSFSAPGLVVRLNPFTGAKSVSGETPAQARARVFGQLRVIVPKGGLGTIPKGETVGAGRIPTIVQKEIDKLKLAATPGPNQLISSVAAVAERLKNNFAKLEKFEFAGQTFKKLDVDSFINAITKQPSKTDPKSILAAFATVSATPDDLRESPLTETGRFVDEGIGKQIEKLQSFLKQGGLQQGKFKEFTKILEKRGFEFKKQEQIDEFIEKFIEKDDAQERLRKLTKTND